MISPSPTQQSPNAPEEKTHRPAPIKKRTGETTAALFVKGIFRPIFKLLYYIIKAIRNHKLATALMALLLLASISTTNYLATGQWPFGIGNDPFNFQIQGAKSGEKVKNWLYALRNGDALTLQQLSSDMSQPPDTSQLISRYGQTNTRVWKAIKVMNAYSQDDTSVDSFVTVEMSSNGPGGKTDSLVVWHFITVAQGQREYLLGADVISVRRLLS